MTWRRNRGWWLGTWAAIAAGVIGGAVVVSGTDTPPAVVVPSGTAHLWVDSDGGTCTRQSSPASYVDAAACASFSAAASAASAGDTVRVKAGSYGAQSVTKTGLTRDSNFDNNIQFIADGGAGSVTVASLSVGSSSQNTYGAVSFDGFHSTGGPAIQWAKDVRFANMEANDMTYVSNSQDIKFQSYTVQPNGWPSPSSAAFDNGWGFGIAQQTTGSAATPANFTWDGVIVRGVRATLAADHPDGVFMYRGGGVSTATQWTNFTVRNSLFYNNECINWRYNDANPVTVTFENNFFDSSVNGISGCGYYSISVASESGTYRNNTIRGGIQVREGDCPANCGATRVWRSNILLGGWSNSGCSDLSGDTWNKNMLDGSNRCSTNDTNTTTGALAFVGGSTYPDTMFIGSSSVARDAGDTGSYPATDYLGHARPVGSAPDVGAYEYGG